MTDALALVVRRTIRAPVERVFSAWTEPAHVLRWWGPGDVTCCGAEIDLRVGGGYRIGNRRPDGTVLWIAGEFERVDPPHELVFSWRIDDAPASERVTVRFEPRGNATEVIVVHERIDPAARPAHAAGWEGCLDGLVEYVGEK